MKINMSNGMSYTTNALDLNSKESLTNDNHKFAVIETEQGKVFINVKHIVSVE